LITLTRQWVVYDHPADAPDYFMVRGWTIGPGWIRPDRQAAGFRELERARAWIQQEFPGAVMLSRHPSDEPQILEVWL
jgi:hypothetical protein